MNVTNVVSVQKEYARVSGMAKTPPFFPLNRIFHYFTQTNYNYIVPAIYKIHWIVESQEQRTCIPLNRIKIWYKARGFTITTGFHEHYNVFLIFYSYFEDKNNQIWDMYLIYLYLYYAEHPFTMGKVHHLWKNKSHFFHLF